MNLMIAGGISIAAVHLMPELVDSQKSDTRRSS